MGALRSLPLKMKLLLIGSGYWLLSACATTAPTVVKTAKPIDLDTALTSRCARLNASTEGRPPLPAETEPVKDIFAQFFARENWYRSRDIAQEGMLARCEAKKNALVTVITRFNAEVGK